MQNVLEQILQEPIKLQAASRTDKGVHAEGQIVNFITQKDPPKKISLNRLLPSSIRVLEIIVVPIDFHPSLHATGKLYTYQICFSPIQLPFHRHVSWHVPALLDIDSMREAATHLLGEHDFSAFCNVHENLNYPHKRRYIERIDLIQLAPNRLQIQIKGNHFLYKMVRNLVGTLAYVGSGKLLPDAIPKILASKQRPQAGITAPAHGLTLQEIYF